MAALAPPEHEARRATRPAYRADIDGLRAIAVAAVVGYHYGLPYLTGGYVGVDVFFVISGALITGMIAPEIDARRFSFQRFYQRRIRRIAPAYYVMLAVCAVAGILMLLPSDLRRLGRSVGYAAAFLSNIQFYGIAETYFDAGTLASQPLLHCWSLGVEAQFYLVYPALLIAARRLRLSAPVAIAVLLVLSLGLSLVLVPHRPSAAFYLLPPRAWELLLGALLPLLPAGAALPAALRSVLRLGGLAAIAACALLYDVHTPFPGLAALPPCLGAAAIILAGVGEGGAAVGPVLGWLRSPPMVALGRVSYSLYLWHWPVLVLARYAEPAELGWAERLTLFAVAAVLSVLSYRFVEKPIHDRRRLRDARRLWITSGAGLLGLLALGQVLDLVGRGILPLAPLPPAVLQRAQGEFDRVDADCPVNGEPQHFPCRLGAAAAAPDVVLWGNSYGGMWTPGLDTALARRGKAGVAFLKPRCPPMAIPLPAELERCRDFDADALAAILARPDLSTVVVAANWFLFGASLDRVEAAVRQMRGAGRRVVILLAPPQPNIWVPRVLALAALHGRPPPPPLAEGEARAAQAPINDSLRAIAERTGADVIDPADTLCSDGLCPLEADGRALYSDGGHLTTFAARRSASVFDPLFSR